MTSKQVSPRSRGRKGTMMRYAAGHKEQTRARILGAAGRVFRRLGYHGAGVDKVMEEAGLTAGGFYAHFPSKEALLAEALPAAAAESSEPHLQALDDRTGRDFARGFVDFYLGSKHLGAMEQGCPLPTLISEIARGGDTVRESFETIIRNFASRIAGEPGADGPDEERALAILSLCVGGLAIARSVKDEALATRILAACRDLSNQAIGDDSDSPFPEVSGSGQPSDN